MTHQPYHLPDLLPHDQWELSRWSPDQLRAILQQLTEQMDRNLCICMRNHYASPAYIDAEAKLDHQLQPAWESIRCYVYCNLPADFYNELFCND